MEKKILKDAYQTLLASKARFLAIVLLMAIGTFVFIGLKITGPDMQKTALSFYQKHNLADAIVTSNYGIGKDNQVLKKTPNIEVEYGNMQDIAINGLAIRVFSAPKKISTYKLIAGHLPNKRGQIALDERIKNKFKLGQKVTIKQGMLKDKDFKVCGFIRSSEYTSKVFIGTTKVLDGELSGISVVSPDEFPLGRYALARVVFRNLSNLNGYSDEYKEKADKEVSILQKKLNQESAEFYQVNTRQKYPGFNEFKENSNRLSILANIFPVFLFAIAALVSLTTMIRFVEEQRQNIGLLKALGYGNKSSYFKFLLYGGLASFLGVSLGLVGGFILLPPEFFAAYKATTTINNLKLIFSLYDALLVYLIGFSCTLIPVLVILGKELRQKTANLLLPKFPKRGSKIFLEKFTFIWKPLSFNYKVTLRNIFRYKIKMLMTILGVGGCSALLITGFGIQDSLKDIASRQYKDILRYDLLVQTNQTSLLSQMKTKGIKKYSAVYHTQLTEKLKDGNDQNISLIVPTDKQFFKLVKLQDRKNKKALKLNSGAVISEKLAELYHVKKGEFLKLGNKQVLIGGITEMYLGHYIFMDRKTYQQVFKKDTLNNAYLIGLKNNDENSIKKWSQKFVKLNEVSYVLKNISMKKAILRTADSMKRIMVILVSLAILLAIVVIYNLTYINVSERIYELSTIKVLGFYNKEVTLYIYRETMILASMGILLGYYLGDLLHELICLKIPTDEGMFNPDLRWLNFLYSAMIPLIITGLLAFVIHRKIKRINMLDALKQRD